MPRRLMMAAILVVWGASAHGQSLADVAAKEKERRAKTGGAAKSYTDADLQEAAGQRAKEGAPAPGASPSPSPSPAGTNAHAAGPAKPAPSAAPEPDPQEAKKARGAELKARLDETNAELAQAEEAYRAAKADWDMVNDHPWMLAPNEPTVRFKFEAATRRVEQLRGLRDAIEDTARREHIPPGYLR